MAGYLIERDGPNSGTRHELLGDVTRIGRDPANDIVLPGRMCSHFHAEVRWQDPHYVLYDLNSRNRTYLNGRVLESAEPLRDGDVLFIGGQALAFESDETVTAPPELATQPALRIDLAGAQVWVGDRLVRLSAQEYRALALLYRQQGKLVTKEELVEHLWPEYQGGVGDDTIAQVLSRLRRKLGDSTGEGQRLQTVRGLGYRLSLSGDTPRVT